MSPVSISFLSIVSSRRLQDMPSKHLEDKSSRRLQDVYSVMLGYVYENNIWKYVNIYVYIYIYINKYIYMKKYIKMCEYIWKHMIWCRVSKIKFLAQKLQMRNKKNIARSNFSVINENGSSFYFKFFLIKRNM